MSHIKTVDFVLDANYLKESKMNNNLTTFLHHWNYSNENQKLISILSQIEKIKKYFF